MVASIEQLLANLLFSFTIVVAKSTIVIVSKLTFTLRHNDVRSVWQQGGDVGVCPLRICAVVSEGIELDCPFAVGGVDVIVSVGVVIVGNTETN